MTQTSNHRRIRTMIVEDHFVVRVGLAAIINSQPDMVNVAETWISSNSTSRMSP